MDRFDELVEEAKKASNAGNFIQSNELYNQALSHRIDLYIYFEIGKNYFYLNKYNDSANYLNMYLQQENKQKEIAYYALLLLAKIYKLTGYFRKSLLMCEQAKTYTFNDESLDNLYDEINDINFLFYEKIPKQLDNATYTELEKKYTDALNVNPGNQTAIVNLTELYLTTRKYKKVVELVVSSMDKIPDDEVFFKNKLINFLETAQGKTKLRSKPLRLGINLSNACNLECIMCYVKDFKWKFPKEKINEIKDFFPYLEKMMWQGGEVFALDYFTDLLLESSRYPNIQQGIITNAQLLNKKTIDLLVDMNLELTISVDGVNKDTYEKIRKNASFEKLVQNMQYIAKTRNKNNKNFTWGINFVVCGHNDKQLFSLFEIAHRYNADFFCIMPLRDGAMTEIYDNNAVSRQIYEIKKKSAEYNIQVENRVILLAEDLIKDTDIKSDITEWISFEKSDVSCFMKKNKRDFIHKNIQENQTIEYKSDFIDKTKYNLNNLICHIPWQQLILDYDGTFWPDCQCRCDKNNNIIKFSDKVSLSDIWNSKEMIIYRDIITKDLYKNLCKTHCRDGKICDNYFSIDDMIADAKELKDTRNIMLDILYFIKNYCDDKQRDMYFERMYELDITDDRFLFQYARNLIASKRLQRLRELIEKSGKVSTANFDFVNVIMDECCAVYGKEEALNVLADLASKDRYALNKAVSFINATCDHLQRKKQYEKLFDVYGIVTKSALEETVTDSLLSLYDKEKRNEILINLFYFIKDRVNDDSTKKKYYEKIAPLIENKNDIISEVLKVYICDETMPVKIEDLISLSLCIKKENIDSFLNLAEFCLEKQKNQVALKIYNAIIAIDNHNADAYLKIADILYYKQNLFFEAEQILLKAIEMNITNIKIYIDLARIYVHNGSRDKALNILQMSISNNVCSKDDLSANIKISDFELLYLKFKDYLNGE
ncbi:hypothetical protein MASR1M68_07070 [Elusimicrobiota bacterium]